MLDSRPTEGCQYGGKEAVHLVIEGYGEEQGENSICGRIVQGRWGGGEGKMGNGMDPWTSLQGQPPSKRTRHSTQICTGARRVRCAACGAAISALENKTSNFFFFFSLLLSLPPSPGSGKSYRMGKFHTQSRSKHYPLR